MYRTPFTTDEIKEAQRWFIERFLHTDTTRNFALRQHKLVTLTPDQAKKLKAARIRYAAFDFHFEALSNCMLVVPNTAEAEWCRGGIWYDPKEESFTYMTMKRADLFVNLDIPGTK